MSTGQTNRIHMLRTESETPATPPSQQPDTAARETLKVWGVSASYFTGKLETYLRYKRIDYVRDHPFRDVKRVIENAGAIQVPLIERANGRWMSDTTPTIQALEDEFTDRPVIPANRVLRFITLLIEDYADEWLWRSAMHFRWSYDHDRELVSRSLVDEMTAHMALPRFLRLRIMKWRQQTGWVRNDGVNRNTRPHVEQGYHRALELMSAILQKRPYLLGASPSLADIGLMGPMLRHFSQDPTPAAIMRNTAPAVNEWVARTWNAGNTVDKSDLLDHVPDDLGPLLEEIAETHVVQLRANLAGFIQGTSTYPMNVQGCQYREIPTSPYRVYCLERLREHFAELCSAEQDSVRSVLTHPEYELIWSSHPVANCRYDAARRAPYNKSINVYPTNVLKGRFR